MDDTRSDRWMLLAGPLFLAMVVALMALEGGTVGVDATAEEVIDHYVDGETTRLVASFLAIPAAVTLLAAVSRIRAALGDRARAFGTLFQSGAVLYAGGLTAGAAVQLGLLDAADNGLEGPAQALNVLSEAMWLPFVAGIAALLLGGGFAVLRTGLLPRWLGWVGAVVGVVSMLGPGGFLGYFVAPIWLAIAGVLLYLSDGAPAGGTTA